MKVTKVNAGLAESNGRLLPGLWRDSLHVTCGLTACTPGSAPGPTLGNEYGKTVPFTFCLKDFCDQSFLWFYVSIGNEKTLARVQTSANADGITIYRTSIVRGDADYVA